MQCDTASLLSAGKCFLCLSIPNLLSIKTYLACQYANAASVAAPTNPDILASSTDGNLIVSWSQAAAPTTNEVWRSKNGGAYALFASVAGALTQKIDNGAMVALDEWCYEIRACTGGCSAFTSPVCAMKAFQHTVNTGVVTYSFPEVVFHIGNLDISNQSALTTVAFANLHTSTGYVAVYQSALVNSISFPKLISTGGLIQFSGPNANVASISLPALTTVGGLVNFDQMTALTSISMPLLASVGNDFRFSNTPALISLSVPSLVSIVGFIEADAQGAASVTFPVFNSSLGIHMSGCTNLTSLSIPSAAFILDDFLCSGNPLLTTVDIPNFVFTDGFNVDFSGCALNATSVNLILRRLVLAGVSSDIIDLSGGTNAAPTGLGLTDKAALIVAGNTVTTN